LADSGDFLDGLGKIFENFIFQLDNLEDPQITQRAQIMRKTGRIILINIGLVLGQQTACGKLVGAINQVIF